jgi:hypothetical protein
MNSDRATGTHWVARWFRSGWRGGEKNVFAVPENKTRYLDYQEPGKRSQYSDWLRARRPMGRSSSLGGGQKFSFLHIVQIDFGANSASYQLGKGGSFSKGKAAGGAKLTTHLKLVPKEGGSIHPLPNTSSRYSAYN